ncbi:hypothetical protein FH972_012973 [Carpinus fangiana]|uniref:T-complex protein 11 n=1 Tax=Carpinus fangiana TaxID=176857 RepID=A0A5N6R5A4_9ROSI|nr:hypothetical protein FH972_012973 [Carpinus fangiana]
MATGVELTETDRVVSGIVLSFPVNDDTASSSSSSQPPKVPRRLRRRLLEPKIPSTAEEIEAKLRGAHLRRQQYYELLSSKARPKSRSPQRSSSSRQGDLGQRLEAKLNAAEQKRLSILAKVQMRLARLDELRQAAKTGVEMRFEKERDELGMKVESRVQQAEANRMLLLKASRQRRLAKREQAAKLLMQKMIQDSKYKECVRAAILRKRTTAEKKRLGLLEAEKTKAHAMVSQVQRVAKSIYTQREFERMRMKDQLEDRLQRAKKQRAEYLRQRRSSHDSVLVISKTMQDQGEYFPRKLARCWRQFVRLRKTTSALAKAFTSLEISEKSVKSMPFEQLALQIESDTTIQAVKALLDRLESRYMISRAVRSRPSSLENIDHLLKRVASPIRKGNTSTKRKGSKAFDSSKELARSPVKLSRYPVRVVLCAYMILGFPDTVISGNGVHEAALAESAANFTRDFELLIKIILEGAIQNAEEKTTIPCQITFRSQLEAFDKAWCSYLYHFVVWKVKDAKSLEEDLVRAACQLELSMMQTCKPIPEKGDNGPILKQVTEDRELLRTKVQHLSGNAGLERMECALSDMRSRFLKARDSGSSSAAPFPSISSSCLPKSPDDSLASVPGEMNNLAEGCESLSPIVHSLSERDDSSSCKVVGSSNDFNGSAHGHPSFDAMLVGENELLVNEIVHEHRHDFADSFIINDEDKNSLNEKVRETMEKAFWDGIMESMKQEEPDFSWVLKLMKEVRDELCEMSPQSWKQEIVDAIDIDILSKTLKREISKARIRIMEPLIKGPAGLEYLKKAFANRYGSPVNATTSLPLTRQWLSSVRVVAEEEWDEYRDSQSTMASNGRLSQGLPPTTLRTGGSIVVSSKLGSPTVSATGKEQPECKGERVELLVRLGLLKLVSEIGGLALETLPETLKLNFARLRAVQSQLQKIIVISTSMLVLRQTLLSENLVTSPLDMDNIVSTCVKQLSDLLDSVEDVGVPEIVETISGFPQGCDHVLDVGKFQARKHVMANMLAKSLQAGDPIFARVSRTAYLAGRGAVLGGNGTKGRKLVETALQRLGAALLTDKLMEAAEVLIVVAVVSGNVHGAWYEELLNSL